MKYYDMCMLIPSFICKLVELGSLYKFTGLETKERSPLHKALKRREEERELVRFPTQSNKLQPIKSYIFIHIKIKYSNKNLSPRPIIGLPRIEHSFAWPWIMLDHVFFRIKNSFEFFCLTRGVTRLGPTSKSAIMRAMDSNFVTQKWIWVLL